MTGRTCTIVEEIEDDSYLYACEVFNPIFAFLTLFFIYWPSINVIGTLLGPKTSGDIIFTWGIVSIVMLTIGGFSSGILKFPDRKDGDKNETLTINGTVDGNGTLSESLMDEKWSNAEIMIATAYTCLFVILVTGMLLARIPGNKNIGISILSCGSWTLQFITIPMLLPICPIIFIIIKLLGVLKPKNKLLKAESTLGSRGEGIFEAAPQFTLQCYIVFLSMSSSWIQVISIITSSLSLSLPNIEQYVTARKEEFGPRSILKIIGVLGPAVLFKLLAVSLLVLFFREPADVFLLPLLIYFVPFAVCMAITNRSYNRSTYYYRSTTICKDFGVSSEVEEPLTECMFISWLTTTNLGEDKIDALLRKSSSLLWTMCHTISLSGILLICNRYDISSWPWSELALVKDHTMLNIIIITTICLGWMSLLLDVIISSIKNHCRHNNNNSEDQDDE